MAQKLIRPVSNSTRILSNRINETLCKVLAFGSIRVENIRPLQNPHKH
jgi:hypothetical protein